MTRKGSLFVLFALLLVLGACTEGDDPGANGTKPSPSPVVSGPVNDYGGSLILAAAKGDQPAVELLISRGRPVNETDKSSGSNPLFEAIYIGHLPIIKLLVDHGADVNAKMNNGQSMLAIAKVKGKPEVIAYLESKGAK